MQLITNEIRTAWLEIGGYIAAGDGLSDEEAASLAGSASGPEMELDVCLAAIHRGAGYDAVPANVVEQAKAADHFIRLQCLSEVFGASAVDGVTEPEWTRIREVADQVIGAEKGAQFIRVCELELELDQARSSLLE